MAASPHAAGSPPPPLFARAPFWVAGWALVVGAALAFRPLLPIDETRYAAVGWEMWLRRDLLVPHLNGVPYSDKPPLLFWLIQAWMASARLGRSSARLGSTSQAYRGGSAGSGLTPASS